MVYADGRTTEATVASASASGIMALKYIDYAVANAKSLTGQSPIRPIKVNGEDKYVMFLHPYQVVDLRTNSNSGQWLDIQKAAMAGMNSSKSPIYTGALGEYNGVVLHESTRIPRTTNSASFTAANQEGVYRSVLLGAQAATIAFGQDNSENKMTWVEELFDYGNQLGVSSGMIWGCKKTVFNSTDFGTITIPTYSIKRG